MKGQTTKYTEAEPFEDDFNDGNYTGWSAWGGTWSAANMVGVFRYHAQPRDSWRRGRFRSAATAGMTPGSAATIAKANTDNDNEVRFSYVCNDTSNAGYALTVSPRYASSGDRIYLLIKPGVVTLNQRVGGVWSSLDAQILTSTQGIEYTIRVVCDGQDVQVFRTAPGALEEKILSTSSCTVASTNNVSFTPSANADYSIDNIRVLSNDLSNTTTFAVNNANELTSMTDYNGSTTFGFDAWGRMTSKARGSYAATYGYRYGDMLCSVASDFPGEGDVTYEYGEDGKRRERHVNGQETYYRWGSGRQRISDEDGSGTLQNTYIGAALAHVSGENAATGEVQYYLRDFQRSIRSIRDQQRGLVLADEWTPVGKKYFESGASIRSVFSELDWDSTAHGYLALMRFYDAQTSRWNQRDPLSFIDSTNLYLYVKGNPIAFTDPLGSSVALPYPWVGPVAGGCALADGPFPVGDFLALALLLVVGLCAADSTGDPPPGWIDPENRRTCSGSVYDLLVKNVHEKCKNVDGMAKCRHEVDDMATLTVKMEIFSTCLAARMTLNRVCFNGGTKNHRREVGAMAKNVLKCAGEMELRRRKDAKQNQE
ncbi:MAG: hypothetical protein AMXMBFR82_49130 [Candidatus Hydrogenedentota bacterium]